LFKNIIEIELKLKWYSQSIDYLLPAKKEEAGDSSVSWLQKFVIHTITSKCSRNNTPSGSHSISKIVRNHTFGESQLIVIACEKRNSIACASAVARVFPLFTTKTKHDTVNMERKVNVAFYFTDTPNLGFSATSEDVECYSTIGMSVRLTAKIVDSPCADMTTTHFLNVIIIKYQKTKIYITNIFMIYLGN
jgi:probable aminopeptidase NPEPL1